MFCLKAGFTIYLQYAPIGGFCFANYNKVLFLQVDLLNWMLAEQYHFSANIYYAFYSLYFIKAYYFITAFSYSSIYFIYEHSIKQHCWLLNNNVPMF